MGNKTLTLEIKQIQIIQASNRDEVYFTVADGSDILEQALGANIAEDVYHNRLDLQISVGKYQGTRVVEAMGFTEDDYQLIDVQAIKDKR
jgi:hypothetical protein